MERIVAELRRGGHLVLSDDLVRLSPLAHRHINMLGKFSFDLDAAMRSGKLGITAKRDDEIKTTINDAGFDVLTIERGRSV